MINDDDGANISGGGGKYEKNDDDDASYQNCFSKNSFQSNGDAFEKTKRNKLDMDSFFFIEKIEIENEFCFQKKKTFLSRTREKFFWQNIE